MTTFFDDVYRAIMLEDIDAKCAAVKDLNDEFLNEKVTRLDLYDGTPAVSIPRPGYPKALIFVAPRDLKRRGIQSQDGRNILMHSIAHIEYNAINLALDAAYRFRNLTRAFYVDWISIAKDEARHFTMISNYLLKNGCHYGYYPVHDGLWTMAFKTSHDIIARMALVPRVLEARGLDVTPSMIDRLSSAADDDAASILKIIYDDEIGHVRIGSAWFKHQCNERRLHPRDTFFAMIDRHFVGDVKGPFNVAARLKAGFDKTELELLAVK